MKESTIQAEARLALSKAGSTMFRNNVGMCRTPDGRVIRYGLHVGSSDLIGFTPKRITAADVGKTIAVFTAIEMKRPGKKPTIQQQIFLQIVKFNGGLAGVATSPEEAAGIVR